VAAGCIVIATCRTPANAPELAQVIKQGAKRSAVLACDVDSEKSIESLAAQIKAKRLNVDILFNNAGIATPNHPHDPVLASSAKDMMACMQTNLIGTMVMT